LKKINNSNKNVSFAHIIYGIFIKLSPILRTQVVELVGR